MRYLVLFASLAFAFAQEEKLVTERSGKYEVALRLPPDGLYAGEEMQIEFRVVDTSQVDPVMGPTPVIRATLQSSISMPAMAGMPKVEEAAHVEGVPGEYGVHPSFPHGGEYQLDLTVQPPEGKPFTVRFPLAVGDSAPKRKKPLPRTWTLEFRSAPKAPKAGEPAELTLSIRHKDNPKEPHTQFEIQHEKIMHLLIVRSDLGFFAHEHPDAQDGIFRLKFAFPTGGEYHLFADIAPRGAGSQVLLGKLKVNGAPGERFDLSKVGPNGSAVAGSLRIALQEQPGSLPARKTAPLTFSVSDAQSGQAVSDLQPYLGAMGHLILIHSDGTTLVHSHPDERQPNVGRDGRVPFLARFPKEGSYRGWIQFRRGGQVVTAAVVLRAGTDEVTDRQ